MKQKKYSILKPGPQWVRDDLYERHEKRIRELERLYSQGVISKNQLRHLLLNGTTYVAPFIEEPE